MNAAGRYAPPSCLAGAGLSCKLRFVSTSKLAPHCHTDFVLSYEGLGADYAHQVVDHAVEYVNGKIYANGLEHFWSLLKRGIRGTYVSVEPFHLFRYLDEQTFRYNNRLGMNDADRFSAILSQVAGKRLTFAEVTGKVGETAVN